jgi:hypothetical protein
MRLKRSVLENALVLADEAHASGEENIPRFLMRTLGLTAAETVPVMREFLRPCWRACNCPSCEG